MAETSRQTYFLVVLSCILFASVNGRCPSDKFGDSCRYECHCSSDGCEQNSGRCVTGCAPGWSGPSCQKQNIALKGSAAQSSTFCEHSGRCLNASHAVDGSRDQSLSSRNGCSSTQPSSYNEWSITWSEEHYITNLLIYNRIDCCQEELNGFRVTVTKPDGQNVLCYDDNPTRPSSRSKIPVRCSSPLLGTSLTVTLNGPRDVNLTLCEVEVYVCAAGWYGEECDMRCSGPKCQKCDPTGTYCQDCGLGRYGEDCSELCHCYDGAPCERNGSCPGKGKKLCARGWKGTSCSTACPDYKYGVDCAKDCGKCWDNAVCLRENGSCPMTGKHRCQPGYYKQRCVKECPFGKWGADCSSSCGYCEGGLGCSAQTGECVGGKCMEGWQGPLCKSKICPDKKFGENCEHDCGMCYGGKVCNKTTGHCPYAVPLCQPGATGPQCRTNCSAHFYGADCKETCGNCYKNLTCEPVTGICPNQARNMRCQPGWAGDMCTTRCSKGLYGVDCKSVCSDHCMVKEECDPVTGACVQHSPTQAHCEPGWSGVDCQTGCVSGKYGSDCHQNCGHCHMGSCDVINGTCYKSDTSPRCLVGFRGLRCQTPCKNGTFGADCKYECHCKGGKPCDKSGSCPVEENGLRLCEPGWIGHKCNTACSANRYGEGCRSECGHCHSKAECNIHTGACPQPLPNTAVCQEGWTGDRCDTEEKSAADNTLLLVCVCVASSVLLVALAVFLILYIRRRTQAKRRQASGDDPQQLFNLLGPEERNGVAKSELKSNRKRLLLGKQSDETGKVTPLITTTSVQISELLNFISTQRSVQGFKKEHELLPKGLTASTTEASKPENKAKNRFQGIMAYDHSRVVLNLKDGVPCSDYINACFVHGYNEQFRYIASQGPMCLMMDDFWRMIWQFDCTRIIMLTNLVEDARRKCDLYWPSSGNKKFGDVSVSLLETEAYADFTIRTFSISNDSDASAPGRIVKQFHFTSWPDHGVPHYPTALVHFREKVHTTNTTGTGPLVVHCSAGIGRTGTFIGLDYLIDQAKAEDKVDVLHCVLSMRKQRVNMIQTEEQYAFLYEALAEAVLLSDMSMEASKFEEKYRELQVEDPSSGQTGLQEQFEMLASMSPTVNEKDCVSACLPENLHRNRDPSVLAVDHWRPFLSTQWTDTTDYINAVFLPAYRDNNAFIATQMPLPHTTVDMWRLVHGQKSQCLLMLNDLEAVEDEKCVYWPYDNTTEGKFGPFKVQVIEVEKNELYDVQTMTVTYTPMPDKEPFRVKQFVAKFWPEGRDVPANLGDLVTLIEEVDRWRQQCSQTPVIVHCMNGADKCGLYCAVSGILERLKIDQEVNILQTVKQMRINRPQVIKNLTQYQACFDAVVAFLESFQTYSNFK